MLARQDFINTQKIFFKAGVSLEKGENFSPVPYYLYCRSIELVTKSFMLGKGFTKEELKNKYSHDLISLISKVNSFFNAKILSDSEEEVIAMTDNYYSKKNKWFEYFEVYRAGTGYSNLPDLVKLEEISSKLLRVLKISAN